MGDFFKVGETYENRLGEYEVVEVKTPELVIRYLAKGRTATVEEALQERIVRNLRREREAAAAPPELTRAARARAPRRRKVRFQGFQAGDFNPEIEGTTNWRTKAGLAGWLAESLTDHLGLDVASWAPGRQRTGYLTQPDLATKEREADSAYYFMTCALDGLTYGLRVRRPADNPEGASSLDRLLGALSDDEQLTSTLEALLLAGTLELTWYSEVAGPEARERVRGDGNSLIVQHGTVTDADTPEALLERLQRAPADQGLWLTIETGLDAQDALDAGQPLAQTILETMIALGPFFAACVG